MNLPLDHDRNDHYWRHKYFHLAHEVHQLFVNVTKNQQTEQERQNHMADPLSDIAAIKAAYEAKLANIATLTQELATATSATDNVSPDVQTALDALAAEVAAPVAAPTTPPASS